MNEVFIHGIGLAAPGLANWADAKTILCGEAPYVYAPLASYRTQLLPRNEARRAGHGVSMAFRVAEQACAGHDTGSLAGVFASSAGDIDIADWLCAEVNTPAHAVSPTRFHNSVHNAAAGYWSIATGSREPANSLSGGLDGFTVALRDAWATLATSTDRLLLVSFDMDGEGMLHAARRPIVGSFGVALLLARDGDGALARITRPELTREPADTMPQAELERFRQNNPSARSLPLLAALARPATRAVILESGQGNLTLGVETWG